MIYVVLYESFYIIYLYDLILYTVVFMLGNLVCPQKDNAHVLEKLFEKYQYLMYHVAYEILNDCSLAEDTVLSVFLQLSKNTFEIDEITSNKTRAFMIIITRNQAINLYKKRKREIDKVVYLDEEINEIPDNGLLPADIVLNKVDVEDVVQTLKQMDVKYADVLNLKFFYGFSDQEISVAMGITVELVRVRVFRARKLLISRLVGENKQ